MASSFLILAQGGGGQGFGSILFIGALFLIMYFVMIRPQQKQLKEQKAMLSALKKGDDVVTQGGMLGTVHLVTDKIVTLEVANNVRVRILKSSIQGKVKVEEEPAKKEEK
ncbi:MAG: preprotein translocase subunit YajC [Myxococcota bacterium]